jgi:membrane protease YdiL (CAAX protease family)
LDDAGKSWTAPTTPEAGRADILRAAMLLPAIVGGTCAIVAFLPAQIVSFAGGDGNLAIWFGISMPAALIGFAFLAALLLRRPIRLGWGNDRLTASALPIGVGGVLAALGLAWLAGVLMPVSGETAFRGVRLFLLGSLLIVAAAAAEEFLFRGVLQPILCRAWGPIIGIVLASLAFAVVHIVGGWSNGVSLMNIVLGGIWFGLLAWRTGGIFAPILAHAGYNWAEEMLFGASPNPGTGAFGSLLNYDLVGSRLWGGSTDGLNGSLSLTLVLLLIISALLFWQPLRTTGPKRAQS